MTQTTQALLVVDDEINILKAMRRLFKQAGYDVFTANSGHEALHILKTNHIDVVLSDFRMPVMNGGELLCKVKQLYPNTTNLIISGYTDFDSVVSVLNEGVAIKFLTKPWDNQALLQEIASAFKHNQTQREQNSVIKSSNSLKTRGLFVNTIETLKFNKHAFVLAYIHIQNCLDLRRATVSYAEVLPKVLDRVKEHTQAVQSFAFKKSEMVLLLPIPDEYSAHVFISQVLHSELNADWIKSMPALPELAVSFISSFDFDIQAHSLYETLQEAASVLSDKDKFVSLNNQYLESKKRRLTIKSDVRKALQMNEFSLAYQPKVTLATGLVESAEILLRWRHKQLGWVSPTEFINIAEADGQIHDIGDWVVEYGIQAISRLSRACHEFKNLSINVSANQLMNLTIVNTISATLNKYNVAPERLIVEVTETSLIKNLAVTSKTLHALKKLGLKIAIDDFGVGYSSFAYLSKLPVDILKIDRAMIDDIEYNQDAQLLLENLVKTCHDMNIKVVAEGVETEQALEQVRLAKCDYVQGYYYSAAVAASEIEKIFIMQPYRI